MTHKRIVATLCAGLCAVLCADAGATGLLEVLERRAEVTYLGAAAAETPVRIVVSLKLRNREALEAFIRAAGTPGNPAFGAKLTSAQFAADHSPTAQQAQRVADYLERAGFTGVSIASNRAMIGAEGSAAAVSRAFHTGLSRYGVNGRSGYLNDARPFTTDAVEPLINSVLGLQTLTSASGMAAKDGLLGASDASIEPTALAALYHAGAVPAAAHTVGAVIMIRDVSYVLDDLRTMEQQYALPPVPVEIRYASEVNPAQSSDVEAALDSQSAYAMAGSFEKMIFYSQGGLLEEAAGLSLPALSVNQWAADNIAPQATMSFAECEAEAALDGTRAAIEQALMQAVAQGQTLFVASGDSGGFCGLPPVGVNAGLPAVTYPASSAYAIGVGGTRLHVNPDGSYAHETGWPYSGGGASLMFDAPAWQMALTAETRRGVPDVAMMSAPGISIILDGQPMENVTGTSLAAPLAMGAWSRIQSTSGNRLGFAGPVLYAAAQQALAADVPAFIDITESDPGDNTSIVLYPAMPGYDRQTGLGAIDICRLATVIHADGTDYCSGAKRAPAGSADAFGGAIGLGSLLVLLMGVWRRALKACAQQELD